MEIKMVKLTEKGLKMHVSEASGEYDIIMETMTILDSKCYILDLDGEMYTYSSIDDLFNKIKNKTGNYVFREVVLFILAHGF